MKILIYSKNNKEMELTIQDDVFLKKIFKRKWRRGIAYHGCIMDYLSRPQKVAFTLKRLMEVPLCKGRIIIQYWEDEKKMIQIFACHGVKGYEIVRPYKHGVTPGLININVSSESFNAKFLQELFTRHYGKDFSTDNAIDIVLFVVIDTGENEIIAFHFYDDRGFYEYFVQKSRGLTPKKGNHGVGSSTKDRSVALQSPDHFSRSDQGTR